MDEMIHLTVNGRSHGVSADPRETLLDVLHDRLKIRSVHRGCEEGQCGACTVLLNGKPVCSCLIPSAQAEGAEVLTTEGLYRNGEPHPLIQAFIAENAIQCGFCTPGFVMTAYYLIGHLTDFSDDAIRRGMEGNICRCTGYTNILQAIKTAKRAKDAGAWW